jgi:hypothetical protein
MFYVVDSLSEERLIHVSPADPQFYAFSFRDNVETVLLRVDSDDDICMTVSIQNKSVSCVVMKILTVDSLDQCHANIWIRKMYSLQMQH